MLRVDDLVVHYGRIPALQGVSLEVGEGELVAVIGPNGAGKSTLLLAIAGGIQPTAGDIRLEDESLLGTRPERIVRRGLAFVPEGRHIFGRLSVEENLRLGTTPRRDRGEVREDMRRVLELFPALERYFRSNAGKLSGGEQQQLAIARALLSNPRLLMLDEPSLGLAPIVIERVFETLAELRARGVTILLVEQAAAQAVELADRTYVLRTGRIELSGTREELANDPRVESAFFGFTADVGKA